MAKKYRTVKLEEELIKQLEGLKHPGQSLNGVIQEMMDKVKKE